MKLLMSIESEESYISQDWPKVLDIVERLLSQDPNCLVKICFQEPFSIIYHGICRRFSEKMYNDLTAVITKHLLSVSDKLKEVNDPLLHVQQFSYHLNQYKQALKAIVSLFHHLNRYYVTTVLHKDLSRELTKLFNQHISDNSQLFAALNALGKRSFAIGPENLSDIIQQLYALNPDYAKRAPEVFARFIPNVFGSTDESDIPALIQWTKELQEQFPLRGVYPSANSHKRKMDSD